MCTGKYQQAGQGEPAVISSDGLLSSHRHMQADTEKQSSVYVQQRAPAMTMSRACGAQTNTNTNKN